MSIKKPFSFAVLILIFAAVSIGSFTIAHASGQGCIGNPCGSTLYNATAAPSSITPTTATIGVPVTLSSVITNSGSVATNYVGYPNGTGSPPVGSATYYDLFQISTNGGSTYTNITGNITGTVLAAGASAPITTSYTFTSGGTYYVRAIGDVTDVIYDDAAASNGILGNNGAGLGVHGAWTAITVPYPTPTAAISANPSSLVAGSGSTVSWSSTNATSCTGTNFSTGGATSGSVAVYPGSTTTYSVSCSGSGGTGSASTQISVSQPPAPTAGISANPTSIIAGNSSTISWSSGNSTSCTGTNFSTGGATSGSVAVTPGSTTTYSVSCSGAGGTATASTQVSVTQLPVLNGTTGAAVSTILNQPVTLTGTVYNAGAGAASNFPNVIQVCDGNCATINTLVATQNVTYLASGATSGTLSASYTPATTNQLYYRMCANLYTSDAFGVTQSSYANNCGAWQYLNVQPPVPAAPTNLTTTCSTNGTSVSFSWTPDQYATVYYPRMYAPTAAQCTSYGWQVWTGDNLTCYPNPDSDTQTSFSNFPITPGQSYSWWVNSANSTGNDGQYPSVNFSCSGIPNITATTGSNVNATINQPVTLSGSVTNTSTNGGTGAAGSFPNIIQVCDANCTTLDQVIAANNVNSLALGSSAGVSVSYTPPTTNQLYYRACGNEYPTPGENFAASITESDYGDNCGSWSALTVSYPAVGGTCSVSPTSTTVGSSVTWSASPSGGSGTYTYQWGGNVSGSSQSVNTSYSSAGSYTGQVTISSGGQNYTAYCSPGGSSNPLTVISCVPTFTSNPSSVALGASSVLSWSEPSLCASSCTGTGFSTGGALSGTASVVPATSPTTSYGLTCSAQPTVYTGISVSIPSVTLTASPTRVAVGSTTKLSWTSTNTNTCSITRGGVQITGGSGTSGTNVTDPTPITSQTKYTATCTTGTVSNPGTPVTATTIVNVVPSFNEF